MAPGLFSGARNFKSSSGLARVDGLLAILVRIGFKSLQRRIKNEAVDFDTGLDHAVIIIGKQFISCHLDISPRVLIIVEADHNKRSQIKKATP